MELEFSRHIFEKYSNTNLMKIRPVEAELFNAERRTDRQTGMTKLMVAFRNFSNAPKKTNHLMQDLRFSRWCCWDASVLWCDGVLLGISRRFEGPYYLYVEGQALQER